MTRPQAEFPIARRQLGLLSVAGIAGSASSRATGAPRGVSPLSFGARGDGRTDDTAAVQAALAAALAHRVPLLVDAAFRLRPGDTPRFHYDPEGARVPMFGCLPLPASGMTIRGAGGRFLIGAPGRTWPPGTRCYMFLSDKHEADGAIRNLSFEGVHFDFDNTTSQTVPSPYAVGLYGATGVDFLDCRWTNATAARRRGWGATLLNCRDVTFARCGWDNLTQGLNARYAFGFTFEDCTWTGVAEAVDFDGVVHGMRGRNLAFHRCGQCLDLSGATDVEITDVTSDACGNLAQVYDKPTTHRLFADWLAGRPLPDRADYVTSSGVALRRVRSTAPPGENSGTWFQVGIQRRGQWNTAGRPPPAGVVLEDASSEFAGLLRIHEGEVTLRRLRMRGAQGPAAILAEAQSGRAAADSFLDLTLQDVRLSDCDGAGLIARRAHRLRIGPNVAVDGYGRKIDATAGGRSGVWIAEGGRPPGGADISIAGLSVTGAPASETGDTASDLLIGAVGDHARMQISWGDDIRLAGPQPLRLVGQGLQAAFIPQGWQTVALATLAAADGRLVRAEGRALLVGIAALRGEDVDAAPLDWLLLRRHAGRPDEPIGQIRAAELSRGSLPLAGEARGRNLPMVRLAPGEALMLHPFPQTVSSATLRGSVTFLALPVMDR